MTARNYTVTNNDDDERVFAFNGQLYPSYQEMVNAKRQRNADVLAKAALDSSHAAAATRRPTSSDRGLKRAATSQRYQQQPIGERRKSSRLAGDTAPKIYIDSESGGTFTIAGGDIESRLGSQYEKKEEAKFYNDRINDGSSLTIANAVELTGPKWTKDGTIERTEDFMSRILPEIIDDMPIIVSCGGEERDGSPTSVVTPDEQPSMSNKKKSSSSAKDGYELQNRINNLSLEDVSTKICPDRIYSITCHPSPNKLVVCAGDKQGNLGIWNVDQFGSKTTNDDDVNNGVHLFKPHRSVISTLTWNTSGTSLLSSSYDGSVRLFDIESQVFEEVFATYNNDSTYKDKIGYNTDQGYNSWIQSMELDHRFECGKCFYLSTSEGGVMHIDLRAATNKGGKLTFNTVLSDRKINTISLHRDGNIMATAGLTGIVQLWDVRKVEAGKKDKPKPVAWHDAGRSINSAYFSPSGRRLLTTTQSNKLEIYEDAHLAKGLMTPKTSVRHDNQTGRWLSTFMARWHPSTMVGEMFIVGSMQKPRCIEIFGQDGKVLREVRGDALSAVASRCCFHPNADRLIVVGGNSSGRVTIAR